MVVSFRFLLEVGLDLVYNQGYVLHSGRFVKALDLEGALYVLVGKNNDPIVLPFGRGPTTSSRQQHFKKRLS